MAWGVEGPLTYRTWRPGADPGGTDEGERFGHFIFRSDFGCITERPTSSGLNKRFWDFSAGPVVRIWHFHCHGPDSISDPETKILHGVAKNNNKKTVYVSPTPKSSDVGQQLNRVIKDPMFSASLLCCLHDSGCRMTILELHSSYRSYRMKGWEQESFSS